MWITSSPDLIQTPTVIALGNFDGIHRGHRRVIEPILELTASRLVPTARGELSSGMGASGGSAPATPTGIPTVVTFHPHPQEFFTGQRRLLLTPVPEKAEYLKNLGIRQLVRLRFDADIAQMSPQGFFETIVVQQLQAQHISVGQDFCFGKKRAGNATVLKAIAAQHNIPVTIVPLYLENDERISSSAIRHALLEGDIPRANCLLGRPYALCGKVMQGEQLGRTIGFPTANLALPPEKFLPRQGVYATWVYGVGDRPLPGVMNLGIRPTVDGQQQRAEVHLLDWSGDLYDKPLTLHLVAFLRPEQKFASLDELKSQIQQDCTQAYQHLQTQ
ncbi:bifunctional riboflavin kinase/FAD synthetase [Vacuolonema iberomarrocanum]|uniref:bifunctional riboflavin kinase/FAD synthetase n=1 Tax=Vacuolonema iberomarrocanum TaxID=3454632 RepID=UPI0019F91BBE|nr:bifunctional riboflavin kinase/FAD synthetase [filamentous cyanobacterium LEGE 07170]